MGEIVQKPKRSFYDVCQKHNRVSWSDVNRWNDFPTLFQNYHLGSNYFPNKNEEYILIEKECDFCKNEKE